jgi:hypothetical protein
LKEVERRFRLTKVLSAGTGATKKELNEMFDAVSDPIKLRVAEQRAAYGDSTHDPSSACG